MISQENYPEVALYLKDITPFKQLSREEERELAERIQEGDALAEEKLIKANLRFVVTIALEYPYIGLSLADRIAEGNWGLVKAARRFDESRGVKFISYAVWWVRQAILAGATESVRTVRLPHNKIDEIFHLQRAEMMYRQLSEGSSDISGLAQSSGFSKDKVAKLQKLAQLPLSLDSQVEDGSETTFYQFIPDSQPTPEEVVERKFLLEEIEAALGCFGDPRARDIIKWYFGLDEEELTLGEIGRRLGLTRERVRQIRNKALGQLKKLFQQKGITTA